MQKYFDLSRTMSILPGVRDFIRGHAAHKPYTVNPEYFVRTQFSSSSLKFQSSGMQTMECFRRRVG